MGMFCFQCQETCGNHGCTVQGVCGKTAAVAQKQDELIQAVKALAKYGSPGMGERELGLFLARSLFMTITNANFDEEALQTQLKLAEKHAKGTPRDVPLGVLSCADPEVRSRRELLTYGLKGVSAYVTHSAELETYDDALLAFVRKALAAAATEQNPAVLTEWILECGRQALAAMALLDRANTTTFGSPEATRVKTGVGQNPGILVSGHDLRDLAELLEQTEGSGVDVYTHCEMLPAHAYPKLRRYAHLRGHYGTAWHRQHLAFAAFNGPILMTTNCIIPVTDAYRERIFTTGAAGYPGVRHIPDRQDGKAKDFSEVIALAKNCPAPTALDHGELTIGFAHDQLEAIAEQILAAYRAGVIKHFIVMAGCDGRSKQREYFTAIAQQIPRDWVILTAGCAKFRYNKLDLGTISGLPRVLDAGQCNDSYSLIRFALLLKERLGVDDLNDLPITFDLAWYEQKAVAVLLALLSCGVKHIHLGPTLPAFVSPGVAQLLEQEFDLHPTREVAADLAAFAAGLH